MRYHVDSPTHLSGLGVHCLKLMKMTLRKNICWLPWYVMNNDVEDLPTQWKRYIRASLLYACSSWAKHLQLSSQAGGNTSSVLMLVNEFFTCHLLSWLEVLSIEEHLHTAIYSLHDVRSWLTDVSTSYCCNSSAVPHSRPRIPIKIYRNWLTIARDLYYGPSMVSNSLQCTYITLHCLGLPHPHP